MNKNIFITRLREEIAYQWGVFKSVVDWIIFLYLFIPALAIGGYQYYRWWQEVPAWIEGFPLLIVLGWLYLFSWQGRLRTFLEEADQLFLLQKRQLIVALKKWTRNLYVSGYSVGILILVGILAPILIKHYHLSWYEILIVTFYFISLKVLILGLKQLLDGVVSTWKKSFYTIFLFISLGAFSTTFVIWAIQTSTFLLIVIGFFQWLIFWVNSSKRIKNLSTFSRDVVIEKQAKLKYVKSIFLFSEYVEKAPTQKKRSPLFYRNSTRIYKNRNRKKSLQELFLKVFFRNNSYLFQCLQIASITTVALFFIPPVWIKCFIFLGFIIILRMWVRIVYKQIMSKLFIFNVRKDDIIRIQTEHYSVNLISIPLIVIISIVLILMIL